MSGVRPAAVIILAAGEGRRMKSRTPKVLHTMCGRSMLGHVLAVAGDLHPDRLIVVVGQGRDQVIPHVAEHAPDARVVVQPRQEGTGNAVRIALESVGQISGVVVVTYGDTPLLRSQTLADLIAAHHADQNAVTALTARVPDPAGYGRIVLDDRGAISEIVEEVDATPEQRAIDEINSGVYAFDGDLLADAVKRVATDNAKGEEYLTDVVAILRGDGHRAGLLRASDPAEVAGVNDRVQLARARRAYNDRVLSALDAGRGDDRGPGHHLDRRRRHAGGRRRDRPGYAAGRAHGRRGRSADRPRLPAGRHDRGQERDGDALGLRVGPDRRGRRRRSVRPSRPRFRGTGQRGVQSG